MSLRLELHKKDCPVATLMPQFKVFKLWLVTFEGNLLGMAFLVVYWYYNVHPYLTFEQSFTDFLFFCSYLLIAIPAVGLIHWWYSTPVRHYLKSAAQKKEVERDKNELARARALNLPLIAALMSWVGWILGALLYPVIMVGADPGMKRELLSHASFASFVAGSITAVTVFFKLEKLVRTWIIPVVFPDGDLETTQCSYRVSVRGRFLIFWFASSFLPILILAVSPLIKLRLDFPQQEAAIQNAVFPLIFFISAASLLSGVILSVLISSSVAKPLLKLRDAMGKVHEGNLNESVQVLSTDELGQLGTGFNEMVEGLKEKVFIKDTFGRYVSRQVMEEILNGNVVLGGEKRIVTILFSDIRDFTRISESLSPEEVIIILNEYLRAMVDVILSNGGVPDKFLGDGIMAIYGAPLAYGDDAERAVRTALTMREKLQEINEKRAISGKESFRIGIGIHTGEVVMGNIGHIEKMEYTAIGDTVNVSSRIETLTKEVGCDILVSESTYEYLPEIFEARRRGTFELKGRTGSIMVYEILGEKDFSTPEPETQERGEIMPQPVLSPGFATG